jgi:pilus assembly protein CpaD
MRSLKITGSSRLATICVRAGLIAGLAASLAACNTTTATDTTGGIPDDYRARHPISLQEGKKTLVLFVGHGRGSLLPTQRAEVLAFARNWQRDATGGVTIDRPMGGATERAANDSLRETMSIIVQAGVPNNGNVIRTFDAAGQKSSWLRLHYPLMVAHAGPCGLWPDDVGADYNVKHFQNKEYYNFGCAQQRNIAAMVANPSDLVQPRAETPPYEGKRSYQMDKWRKGENPTTTYSDAQKGAISDLGK